VSLVFIVGGSISGKQSGWVKVLCPRDRIATKEKVNASGKWLILCNREKVYVAVVCLRIELR